MTPQSPNNANVPLEWRCPPLDASDDTKLGWLREQREQANTYLRGQRAWKDIDHAFDLISDDKDDPQEKSLSRVRCNLIKRGIREIVATMSNLRVVPCYRTENKQFDPHAEILNKRFLYWWQTTFADRTVRKALQWAAAGGKGYGHFVYEKEFINRGRGEIKLKDVGPRDILPIQIGRDHDIQRAYAVTIVQDVPIFQAHALYPEHADYLVPVRSNDSWSRKSVRAVFKWLSPALNAVTQTKKEDDSDAFPRIRLYYTYVLDLSLNMTGKPVHMGDPGTTWEYTVPAYDSDLPTGIIDARTGSELIRKAGANDSLLFPLRRLLISSDSHVVKDGTSPFWHARVPLVDFQLDDWPWEFLGFPLTHDAAPLQESLKMSLRAQDDAKNARLRPPLLIDKNVISKSDADTNIDLRIPNNRIHVDARLQSLKEVMQPMIGYQYYDVPPYMMESDKLIEERLKYLMGVSDVTAMAKARLIGSDAMEKLMEVMGPLVQDMSRNMDSSIVGIGDMARCMFMQFDTLSRRLQIMGPDGVTEEDIDYEPGSLVPSHILPDEKHLADAHKDSNFSQIERAKWHCNNFYYRVTPGTQHQITQLSRKLLYLQLVQRGFPIDWWTLAEVFDIPNFGPPPKGAVGVMEKWIAQKRLESELAQAIQGPTSPAGPHGGQKGTGGRAPTGHAAPQMKQRPNGSSTIQESR